MAMIKDTKRVSATDVRAHFGRIVREVAATDKPVIIQTRGEDQAVLISLRDFRVLSSQEEKHPDTERERVRAALREAGLLSEPTVQEIAEVRAFEAQHSPEDRARILAEWRQLDLDPPLSEIILRNRERQAGA